MSRSWERIRESLFHGFKLVKEVSFCAPVDVSCKIRLGPTLKESIDAEKLYSEVEEAGKRRRSRMSGIRY